MSQKVEQNIPMTMSDLLNLKQAVGFSALNIPNSLKLIMCDLVYALENGDGVEALRSTSDGHKKFRRVVLEANKVIPADQQRDIAACFERLHEHLTIEFFFDKSRGADNSRLSLEVMP